MPNWCINYLTFQGDAVKINEIKNCFAEMIIRQDALKEGVVPLFFKDSKCLDGFFFELYTDDENAEKTGFTVQYETRWCPNIPDVKAICEHFKVSCELEYQESGCCVFGKYSYDSETDTEQQICLDDTDFDKFEYREESSLYYFEGKEYESETEILETLLERKSQ
jgi:hypothetical protein